MRQALPSFAKHANQPEKAARGGGRGGAMDKTLSDADRQDWTAELEHLRQEHRDLDAAIEALTLFGSADRLQIQRLKKRKLILRDRVSFLDDQLTPDIIA